MPASVASPYQALYDSTPLLLLPGSLARIPHRRASLFLIKLLWKRRKSRRGRSWGEAIFRRSKILHRSVYSALWLGGLRCQYRETNQWATGCSPFGKKNNKKKTFCRPLKCVGPPGKCPVCPITNPALQVTCLGYSIVFVIIRDGHFPKNLHSKIRAHKKRIFEYSFI